MLDSDGKQLLAEAVYLYGNMLLLLDFKIPAYSRERMVVSYYRYKGGSTIKDVDEIVKLCRSNGFSPHKIDKRPARYPEDYFARFPLPKQFLLMLIGRLRSEELYNYSSSYPK